MTKTYQKLNNKHTLKIFKINIYHPYPFVRIGVLKKISRLSRTSISILVVIHVFVATIG